MPPLRTSSSQGTQLRAFSVRGAAEWSHPNVASNQLPGSGESEPAAACPASLTSLNLQGAVDATVPEPRKSHPQRERLLLAGAARAPGARRRAGEGCGRKWDPASCFVAPTWPPEENSSECSLPAPCPKDCANNY